MSDFAIQIKNLKKYYNGKIVLDIPNLVLKKGERLGIIGPNGNGKTTLCEIIAGLRPYDGGVVEVNPEMRIGMQLQDNPFPKKMTVWDFCKFYIHAFKLKIKMEWMERAIRELSLQGLMSSRVNDLSGGQKQRINILLSLISRPSLLIMDELASGLDIASQELIYKFLEFETKELESFILISHNLHEIEKTCTRFIVLIDGKIKEDYLIKDIAKQTGDLSKYIKNKFNDYYLERDKYFNQAKSKKNQQAKRNLPQWERELRILRNKYKASPEYD